MSHSFSLPKSVTTYSLLLAGVLGSLLLAHPSTVEQVEQPVTQLADSSFTNPQATEQTNKTALTLAVATGGVAVGLALRARSRNGSTIDNSSLQNQQSSIISIDSASRKLQKELFILLHEDKKTANRLLTQARVKYPNRTANWYVEKIIYDLKRDRGGY